MGEILKYSSFLVTQCHGFWISIIVKIGDIAFGRIQAAALIYAKKVFLLLNTTKRFNFFKLKKKVQRKCFGRFEISYKLSFQNFQD